MTDPVRGGLDLLAELSRMRVRAQVLAKRARAARVRLLKSINTKAPAATGAGKGNE